MLQENSVNNHSGHEEQPKNNQNETTEQLLREFQNMVYEWQEHWKPKLLK